MLLDHCLLLHRRFGDEYFFDICRDFSSMLVKNDVEFKMIYGQTINYFASESEAKNLVLYFLDHTKNSEDLLEYISKIKKFKKILMFSAQLDSEHVESSNLQIINWGSDFLMQKKSYQSLIGQKDKNFQNDKHWISLSGYPRPHRALAAVFLKGLGWDQFGDVRLNASVFHDFPTWTEFANSVCKKYMENLSHHTDTFEKGYSEIKLNGMSFVPRQNVYSNDFVLDNASNFDQNLRYIYQNTTTEIVNETTFDTIGYHCSEKFQNSVYGFNIPILLGPRHIVRYLESQGFDMLRDIVDTSYDTIPSPGMRLICAIEKNKELLTNKEKSIDIWKSVFHRLNANYEFAKTRMHDSIRDKVRDKFENAIYWLQES